MPCLKIELDHYVIGLASKNRNDVNPILSSLTISRLHCTTR